MAMWTCATTLERLGELLNEEGIINVDILKLDPDVDDVKLSDVVEAMKERIVRDQFTPKAKAAHRKAVIKPE